MNAPHIPFQPGTVRGPYFDRGWVQFLVQTPNGWVPFVRCEKYKGEREVECRHAAVTFAVKHVEVPA